MDTNICVTLVYPSRVKTNILRNARHKDEAAKADLVEMFDERVSRIPPEKMAEAIVDGIMRKREQIVYGLDARLYSWASRFLPRFVIKRVARVGLRELEKL